MHIVNNHWPYRTPRLFATRTPKRQAPCRQSALQSRRGRDGSRGRTGRLHPQKSDSIIVLNVTRSEYIQFCVIPTSD